MSAPIDIYNDNKLSINWNHSMKTKGLRYLQIRENTVPEDVQTNFKRVNHVSGRVNLSNIFIKADKDKSHYITLQDHLMSNLTIMGKVRHCIHICENICVIPTYGDIRNYDSPPNHISDLDCTYDYFCSRTIIYVVESKGVVVKPPDVCPSTGPSVPCISKGIKYI